MSSKKKYAKSFYDDGLGDILEFIDDEILIHSETKSLKERNKGKKRKDSSDEPDFSDGDQEEDEVVRKKSKKSKIKSEVKIPKLYGDNVITADSKYKPPKKAQFELEDHEVKVDKKLEDRARGLINRLAAQTMPFVSSEFEKLYSTNSRGAVSMSIFKNIETSIINKNALAKRKLVAELMLLVSFLDHKISHNIGASLVHRLVSQFETLYKQKLEDSDKRLDNILLCLVNLYQTGLISSNIVFEITKRICSSDFKSKSVELLLLIIKSIGFQLRRDNPSATRQFIISAQECCKKLKSDTTIDSRIEFMMEALGAIKNNNVGKLGNYGCDIDKDTIESTMKILIKKNRLPESLSDATYEEILNSANFYLLDTRLDETEQVDANKNKEVKSATETSKQEKKICKALGLSKPAEKTIFSSLLRVSDFVEASNIIIGFGLNHCSDAMLVCIHVAVHEKKYNPFYFNVINNLCKFNRKYKMAAKFTIQDKIRVLGGMPSERVKIFKVLCLELIKSDAVPITILKSIEWADLSASTKEYLVYLLENISDLPDGEKLKIMSKADKKSSFAGAMRTFTNCFLKGCQLFD